MLALQRDGAVLSWGIGNVGQLGRVGPRMRNPKSTQLTPAAISFMHARHKAAHIVDVAAGSYTSFAVTQQGHVWGWGLNQYGHLGFESQVGTAGLQPATVHKQSVVVVCRGLLKDLTD